MTRAGALRPWAALLVAAALSLNLLHAESGTIEKIEVVKQARVRRAKLYYLRDRKGKAGRMKEKRATNA